MTYRIEYRASRNPERWQRLNLGPYQLADGAFVDADKWMVSNGIPTRVVDGAGNVLPRTDTATAERIAAAEQDEGT